MGRSEQSERLAEIRARLEALTPEQVEYRDGADVLIEEGWNADVADLWVHAPADIAWLLAEVERQQTDERARTSLRAYAIAAWMVQRAYDEPGIAAYLLRGAGLTTEEKLREVGATDSDIEGLRPALAELRGGR